MSGNRKGIEKSGLDERGITMMEVMVAAFLLLVAFVGLAQIYGRGRVQIDYEEARRKATALSQAELDSIRRSFAYDELSDLDDTITDYTVDGRSYRVARNVETGSPESECSTIEITVTWRVRVGDAEVDRSVRNATILARSLG